MEREIKIVGGTRKYILLSQGLTIWLVWENKEWYWSWWASRIELGDRIFIATGVMEELVRYIWLSMLIGMVIGLLRLGLLIQIYTLPGLYKFEGKKWAGVWIMVWIVNWVLIPQLLGTVSNLVWSGQLLPKYIDICQYYWGGQLYGQLIWIGVWLFLNTGMRKIYVKSRSIFLLGVGLIIGLITPPDLTITLGAVLIIFTLCEILLLAKLFYKEIIKFL